MKKVILVFVLSFAVPILGIYRPYSDNNSSAASSSMGATGTSSIDSIQSASMNPSFIASQKSAAFSLGFESLVNVSSVLNYPGFLFSYLPDVTFCLPGQPYGNAGLATFSSFQNQEATFGYYLYNIEAIYAISIFEKLNFGISAGAGMGIAGGNALGGGFTYSLSSLLKLENISVGLLVRPPEIMNYVFYAGHTLEETIPTKIQLGVTAVFKDWTLVAELDYIDWRISAFKENSVNTAPEFQTGFLDFLHPHIGVEFAPYLFRFLKVRLGFYTADQFDYNGNNSRQLLFTGGFRATADSPDWRGKLKLDFSYTSGYLASLFWHENYPLDKMIVTVEYDF